MACLSLMSSRFESIEEFAQFFEQHMLDQSAKFQAYKQYLDDSFFEAVEEAAKGVHESMQQDFAIAVSQEGHRIEFLKKQEAAAWEKRTRQQFANDFKVQVALNKDSLEAKLRAQYDETLAGKDELLRQKGLKLSELESALATSQSKNKDLTSRMKEQEQKCSEKSLTAQKRIQELEGAQATSNASLNAANNQIGQFNQRVQAYQNDVQARDSQIQRHRQDLANETAAHSATRSNRDAISRSLSSVTNQRDQAQGQLAEVGEQVAKLRAKNEELQSQLSEFERRSQQTEKDWADARKYVENLEKERNSLREERNSLQSRVQGLPVVSPHMETNKPGQSDNAEQQQQAGAGPSDHASDEDSEVDDDSDLKIAAPSRRARQPASANAKSNRIGKKKPGKATKVVNVEAVKAKNEEIMGELGEGDFIYSKKTVEAPSEWHPYHPKFNRDIVNVTHKDFNPQALRYATEVQFKLQQENNKAADDSVEASKVANESFVDRISNLNW